MRKPRNLNVGDICVITSTRGHGLKMGERVRINRLHYINADCYGLTSGYSQYVDYRQLRKQPILNTLTKTL
jgi:hypothetical protein